MNWRKKFDLYNAPSFEQAAGNNGGEAGQNQWVVITAPVEIILNIDWRNKIDLYNAHLLAATAATAKAGKFFKIQIKQPISVGMWAEEINQRA